MYGLLGLVLINFVIIHSYYYRVISTPTFLTSNKLENSAMVEDFLSSDLSVGETELSSVISLMDDYHIDCTRPTGDIDFIDDTLECRTRIMNPSFYGQTFYPLQVRDILVNDFFGLSRPYLHLSFEFDDETLRLRGIELFILRDGL